MASTYQDEFKEAHARTLRFGLTAPQIPQLHSRLLTDEKQREFAGAVYNAVGVLTPKEMVAQCFSLHSRLKAPLEQFFGVPIIYTLGHIYIPDNYYFKNTEEELLKQLVDGASSHKLSMHAWLTLPSMEIIDLTIATSLAVINNWDEGQGNVLASHVDDLVNGCTYHPMLLGDEYLRAIGGIVEFQVIF